MPVSPAPEIRSHVLPRPRSWNRTYTRKFRTPDTTVCKLRNRCFQLFPVVTIFRASFSVSIVRKCSSVADCCSCGAVTITAVACCLAAVSRVGWAGSSVPAYPLEVKSESSKSLPGAYGSGFPTLMTVSGGTSSLFSEFHMMTLQSVPGTVRGPITPNMPPRSAFSHTCLLVRLSKLVRGPYLVPNCIKPRKN